VFRTLPKTPQKQAMEYNKLKLNIDGT
jgi:hypothetical protein